MALPVDPTQLGATPGLSEPTGYRMTTDAIVLRGPLDREVGRVTSMYRWGRGRPERTDAARRLAHRLDRRFGWVEVAARATERPADPTPLAGGLHMIRPATERVPERKAARPPVGNVPDPASATTSRPSGASSTVSRRRWRGRSRGSRPGLPRVAFSLRTVTGGTCSLRRIGAPAGRSRTSRVTTESPSSLLRPAGSSRKGSAPLFVDPRVASTPPAPGGAVACLPAGGLRRVPRPRRARFGTTTRLARPWVRGFAQPTTSGSFLRSYLKGEGYPVDWGRQIPAPNAVEGCR